jgi:hypothetical protein
VHEQVEAEAEAEQEQKQELKLHFEHFQNLQKRLFEHQDYLINVVPIVHHLQLVV